MDTNDAVDALRQKYGLKSPTVPTTTAAAAPVQARQPSSTDVFERNSNRVSTTQQKELAMKASILMGQFGNKINREQAEFVLSENGNDIKKSIRSIKVRTTDNESL